MSNEKIKPKLNGTAETMLQCFYARAMHSRNPKNKFRDTKAEELIDRIETLRKTLHLPENFREYGLAPQHYPFILANCRSGSMKCNPRALSDAEISKLLERVS